jgi:hypothetical protein
VNPGLIALMIPLFALGLGAMGIWTSHREKMAKLRLKSGESGDSALAEEVRRLRSEMEALRRSATDYDLAFDKRLDGLEARTETLELRATANRSGQPIVYDAEVRQDLGNSR